MKQVGFTQEEREQILAEFCRDFPDHAISFYEKIDRPRPIKLGTIEAIRAFRKREARHKAHFEQNSVQLRKRELKEKIGQEKLRNYLLEIEKEEARKVAKKRQRFEELLAFNKAGATTLQQMGKKLGVTRDRVRQLILIMPEDLRVQLNRYRRASPTDLKCAKCGKDFQIPSWKFAKIKDNGVFYCSKTCRKKWADREACSKGWGEIRKKRYKEDPVYRQFIKDRNKRLKESRETLHPELRERRLAKMKAYNKVYKQRNS